MLCHSLQQNHWSCIVNLTPSYSNHPLEDWGKLLGEVPSATAIPDRFLHHAEVVQMTGKNYRLKQSAARESKTYSGEAPNLF